MAASSQRTSSQSELRRDRSRDRKEIKKENKSIKQDLDDLWDTDGSPRSQPSKTRIGQQSCAPVDQSSKAIIEIQQHQQQQQDDSKHIHEIILLQQQSFMQMMGMMNETVKSIALVAAQIQSTTSVSAQSAPIPSIELIQRAATAMHMIAGEPLQQAAAAAALQIVAEKWEIKMK